MHQFAWSNQDATMYKQKNPRTHTNPLAGLHAERQFFQRQGKAFSVPANQQDRNKKRE